MELLTTYNEISTIPKVPSGIIFKAVNGKSQIFNKVSKCA